MVLSARVPAVMEAVEAGVVEVVVTFLGSAPAAAAVVVVAAAVAAAGTCLYQHYSEGSLAPMVLSMLGLASNSHHHLTWGSPYFLVQ